MINPRFLLTACFFIIGHSLIAQWNYDGNGYFTGDLNLGAENSTVGYGKKISFGYYGNTDPLWIGRYNCRN